MHVQHLQTDTRAVENSGHNIVNRFNAGTAQINSVNYSQEKPGYKRDSLGSSSENQLKTRVVKQVSAPTCSTCGHIKFVGVYSAYHGAPHTPKHLPSCRDSDCFQCNPEFCTVPISMRLAGYPLIPAKKQKLTSPEPRNWNLHGKWYRISVKPAKKQQLTKTDLYVWISNRTLVNHIISTIHQHW